MKLNGWNILVFKLFQRQYRALIESVKELAASDPHGYGSHPKTKLLAAVQQGIKDAATDPAHPKFQMGKNVLEGCKVWRRVKNGLPPRRRLFFRFFTTTKEIIFAWLNCEGYLRKEGDKNDVYAYFSRLLSRGDVPSDYQGLKKASSNLKC